jgi:hypothetical protein
MKLSVFFAVAQKSKIPNFLEEKMKKILLVLLAFMLVFAIAGCNNDTLKGSPKPFGSSPSGNKPSGGGDDPFDAAAGLTTILLKGDAPGKYGEKGAIEGIKGGSCLLEIPIAGVTWSATSKIEIEYICKVVAGEAKFTVKNDDWSDTTTAQYPTFEKDKVSKFVFDGAWGFKNYAKNPSLQFNNDGNANGEIKLKIISIKNPGAGGGPITVNNPVFTKYGGLGTGTGNSGDFLASQTYVAAMRYEFSAEEKTFTNFKIYYSLVKLTSGDTTKPLKLVIKNSGDTSMGNDANIDYPQPDAGGDFDYSGTLAAFDKGGIAFHHNRGSSADESADFTLTITKIEFTN